MVALVAPQSSWNGLYHGGDPAWILFDKPSVATQLIVELQCCVQTFIQRTFDTEDARLK